MRFNWWRRSDRSERPVRLDRPQRLYRPQVEVLEDRCLFAVSFGAIQALNPGLSSETSGLVSGDFNGDGRLDLVETSGSSAQLSLFRGNGNGTFQNPIVTNQSFTPAFLVAGNFNNDNILDVAVASSRGLVQVFFGTANGGFQPGPSFATGGAITALVAGDLDKNGLTDLVVGNGAAKSVTVFLDFNGAFFGLQSVGVAGPPTSISLGDINGDGFLDAAVGSGSSSTVSILLNTQTGRLAPLTSVALPSGATTTDLVLASFNQAPGLAVANNAGSDVLFFQGDGLGGFALAQTITGIADPRKLATGDFSGGGVTDLAVSNGNASRVTVIPGNLNNFPTPFAAPATAFGAGTTCTFLATADFNDDGKVDLAVTVGGSVVVAQNQSTPVGYFVTSSGPGVQAQINVYSAQGQLLYSFNPFPTFSFTGGVRVAVGNVFGTATPDLVVGTGPGGASLVLVYDGDTVLAGKPILVTSFDPFGPGWGGGVFVATGNLNGVPLGQIVVSADAGGGAEVSVFSIAANIALINPGYVAVPDGPSLQVYPLGTFFGGIRVACADVNGDGLDDIITGAGPGAGPEVKIFAGNRTTFFDMTPFADFFGITPTSFFGGIFVTAGDFEGDFKADVIVSADQGGGPQVDVFTGTSILANPLSVTAFGGFNALIAAGFTGGTRVGTAIGQFGPFIGRVLVSTAGPGGNQLTVFDLTSFLANPTGQPPQFVGVFTPPAATTGNYVS
jgi:hypothetical protein